MKNQDPDAQWFAAHLDRRAHIRSPVKTLEIDKQRAVRYIEECQAEFRTLGPHNKARQRILLYRVPENNRILKIPMLAFADETIEDTDEVLLPIIRGLMTEAAKKYGMQAGHG